MTAKYLYAYIIFGTVFFVVGIYRLITDMHFSAAFFGDMVAACMLFYAAYKAYKTKKDQELM